METSKLKKFAQFARRSLIEQVSAKLKLVLAEGSAARREHSPTLKKLEEAVQQHGNEQVIERVAYTWFNRFCALRFMDVNRYTRIGVVSPAEGQFQPEILAEAKMGHIDEEMVPEKAQQKIFAFLDGKAPSHDPQGEAYRLLVVAACNDWHRAMPFLFERIEDYTELLMPDDLLSGNSILAYTREAMTPDACQDVEVIGWLYQFYISEKKDEVFDGLKKNKKITPENIPAATQLFTPHWIVRYLVENSLGRLWMLNRPASKLIERMDYYIKPEQPESDFLHISKPEEIKICDPACGSGHMLTYAFDLLHTIYEEEGYEPAEIPEMILTHNLYGIEIDERAGELAAFALTMKARARHKRFFGKAIKPNICVLENVHLEDDELKNYMDFVGRDLFTAQLQSTLRQFEEADNFGSLIRPDVTDVDGMLRILESKNVSGHLFLTKTHKKVLQALQQADYLSPKYHVVIANPPYMGSKGMNKRLVAWLKDNYPEAKSDLFSSFIVRINHLALLKGLIGIMSPNVWMYLSSYEALRGILLKDKTLNSLVELPLTGFKAATVQICAFTFCNAFNQSRLASFIRIVEFRGDEDEMDRRALEAIKDNNCGWFFTADTSDFNKIPGLPIAYWSSKSTFDAFAKNKYLSSSVKTAYGLITMDNARFVRNWPEVSLNSISYFNARTDAWIPFNNGGDFRRWYGNNDGVVRWLNDGKDIKQYALDKNGSVTRTVVGQGYYFRPGMAWNAISAGNIGVRFFGSGFIFSNASMCAFGELAAIDSAGALLNSRVGLHFLKILAPTVNFGASQVALVPTLSIQNPELKQIQVRPLVELSKADWDSYETSWDFTGLPLLNADSRQETLKVTYQKLRAHWREMTSEMQTLEEENNRIFIDAYGLRDELAPEVPLNEITLTCNPQYRYGIDKTEDELEALLLADTMREFISYAVGCMFGRYALEKPGLVLANQGEIVDDYLKQVPEPSFPADDDNVIPILDGNWFTDDIAERFCKFLRLTFGEEHYEENLKFIESALGKNDKVRDIRDYFLKDFYTDHVKRYKKRPIYWLFSSPKGSFNALIYMHRYRPDTVGVVLNNYLREFRTKLTSHKNHLEAVSISASSSQGEKTKALKEIDKIAKMITEMEEYEREVLYPLATEQVEIDLDDGVKINYLKFGEALKKIPGLDAKEDE